MSGTRKEHLPLWKPRTKIHEGVVIMKRMISHIRGFFTGFVTGVVFIATVFMSSKSVRDGWNVLAGDKKAW